MYFDIAVGAYILSFLLLLVNFYFNRPILQILQIVFTSIALLANFVQIFFQWQKLLTDSTFVIQDLLILGTLSLGVVYLFINIKYKKPYVGFFVLPMIIIVGLLSLFLTPVPRHSVALESMWLYLHIPLSVIGTAFFLISFAAGIMYVILERQLKMKKFGRIFDRFPPLLTINKINNASVYLGFAFYTSGMLAAIGWVRFHYGDYIVKSDDLNFDLLIDGLGLKAGVSILAWVVFSFIALIKIKRNMSARSTAVASIVGLLSVVVIYVVVVMFLSR